MFNDRDLVILASGGLLAVGSLFTPLPFVLKAILGFLVLVVFMALALLRVGPDRIALEQYLLRRLRFLWRARKYSYVRPLDGERPLRAPDVQAPPADRSALKNSALQPVKLAIDEVGIYPLVTVFLAVLAVYTAVWVGGDGSLDIAVWFGR